MKSVKNVILCIFVFALGASFCSGEVLFEDDFSFLNEEFWSVHSNGGGTAWVEDGCLVIESGGQAGGGTWVTSTQEFIPEEAQTLVFESSDVYLTPPIGDLNDSALWGLDNTIEGVPLYIAFESYWETGLRARFVNGAQREEVLIEGIDVSNLHDYRIEVSRDNADFLVDGELEASINSEHIPYEFPLFLRMDKTSPGWNTYHNVEGVSVSSLPWSDIFIEVTCHNPNVRRQDYLELNIIVQNDTGELVTFDAWIDVLLIGGEPYTGNPVAGPVSVTLGPGGLAETDYSLFVPQGAPLGGPYTLCVLVGDYPVVWNEDCCEFYIVP